jgi:hypothetical protein
MRSLDFWRGLICSTAIVAAAPAYCQDQVRHHVRLPAQPLDSSLRAVALVFGRNVSMPSDVVAERNAPAIDGAYTFEEAVAALLRGSGLEAIPTGRGMAIRQPRMSEGGGGDIVVTGSRIRGTSPAGEQVLALDRKDIDQSGYERDRRAALSLILRHPFFSDGLEGIVGGHLACQRRNSLFCGRIEPGGKLLPSLVSQLPRCRESNVGPDSEVERLLPTEIAVVHPPKLCAVRLHDEVQAIGIGQLVCLRPYFGVGDLDVIQCHDGASSKGLADTIKNTIILMVLPMDSGG